MALSQNIVGDASAAEGGVDRPVSTVLVIIAMQTEAQPIVNKFQLIEDSNESLFPKGVPWIRYHGKYKDLNINLVWPGKDSTLGVDSVGTISASLVTYASIQALKPDLIINAGTAGGFKVRKLIGQWSETYVLSGHKVPLYLESQAFSTYPVDCKLAKEYVLAKGASIGDVYVASDVAFHDRRIPIPVFDLYGTGARRTLCTPNLIKDLNLKVGKVSTGDSLDISPHDEAAILANDATVKDMEAAAIAYVADLLSVPAIFVKAVTDLVDGEKPTAEEFLQSLVAVTAALDRAVTDVIEFINGKCLSDL